MEAPSINFAPLLLQGKTNILAFRTMVALIGIAMVSAGCTVKPKPVVRNTSPRAMLDRYCVVCHNEKVKTADLPLDLEDVGNVSEDPAAWEKVVRKLRTGAMPPPGMLRPEKATSDSLATYLETALDSAAAAKPKPGRPGVHRLNRAEYSNAIRDLLALNIDGESLLPPDNSGYGFDNMGDVLSVSPMLLERYLSAARQITRLAVGDPIIPPSIRTYDAPKFSLQDDRMSESLPFGSRGGIAIQHNFPLDGEYLIRIHLQKTTGSGSGHIIGLSEPHQLDVRLDGARIKLFTIGNKKTIKPEEVEAGLVARFPAMAGVHQVGVAFLDESSLPEGVLRPSTAGFQLYDRSETKGDPGLDSIDLGGPYNAKAARETASRRKIFVCHPTGSQDEDLCAKRILSTLGRLAYRRPLTDRDIQTLFSFYRIGRGQKGFEAGIEMALRRMLVDPEFLFRIERDPPNVAPGTAYRNSDLELASRLSFFLWSSIPDDQLLDLAERGMLKQPEVLEQQVRRMLGDSRSEALMDNFAGQWLGLRSLRSAAPDEGTFPDFDETLRQAFDEEMQLFMDSMLREDHSVLDLLDANYTFVNERLARFYGIPNIYGSRFRRVTLTDEARIGLLGKGSILVVTSGPNRTSPVLRGKWVLENILGTPPPPPPPNVPALEETKDTERMTMRQRMEQHRANAACAVCHSRMDPLGFALDNFDAIGRWRTTETTVSWDPDGVTITKVPIDVSGLLPDGTKFQGVAGLRKFLLSHPEQFATTLTEKLLTYALGRGVEYYDQPAIRKILKGAASSDYRWSALIQGIVTSAPFQMRTSAEQTVAPLLADGRHE